MKTITELIKAIMLLINAGGIARIMILIMNIIIYRLKDAVLEYFK